MLQVISKDSKIIEKLASALDISTKDLLTLDTKAIASEFLSVKRAVEQVELFKDIVNNFEKYDFKEKKLLEVGAGVGTFLIVSRMQYGIESFGLEPSSDEFSPFKEISSAILKEYNISNDIIVNATGEQIPFPDDSFDLIYSTNVLEHVKDPKVVIAESIRVLKSGGYLQFVIPNYFSFWEGHYGIFWPCITNKTLGKIYARLINKNPNYIDTLQLISPFYLKKILKELEGKIEILGWGKDVFKNRLERGNYSDWASLQKIRPIITLIQNLKIGSIVGSVLNAFEMYTPIVLTIKKK